MTDIRRLIAFVLRWSKRSAASPTDSQILGVLDLSADLVQQVRGDGTLAYVNRSWLETLGYNPADVADLRVFDVIHPDSIEHYMQMFSEMMSGESDGGLMEFDLLSRHGRRTQVEGNVQVSLTEDGDRMTTGFFRDVSARSAQRAEEQAMTVVVLPVVARRVVLGLAEHQVLEQVRQAAAAVVLVGGADVVPDLRRHHRMVGLDEHGHPQTVGKHLGKVAGRKGVGRQKASE